jgi:predicted Zn-dependent protease
MKKIISHFAILLLFFGGSFLLLNTIDWMGLFQVKKMTEKSEKKLGELCWDLFKSNHEEIKDKKKLACVDSLLNAICLPNNINRKKISVHLLDSDEVNAFALPGNHLVICTGLIPESSSPEALCGVLGHELAHIENGHVTKKLIKEIGLSTLLAATAGEGGELIKSVVKTITSTAYDRSLEKEADIQSADYLLKAQIDPLPFANFLANMDKKNDSYKLKDWISTHPNSKERGDYIKLYTKGKIKSHKTVIAAESWDYLQKK